MKKRTVHSPIYVRTESGLLVQTGNFSNFTVRDSSSYLSLKQSGHDLHDLYRKNGLIIPPASYLAKLIVDTGTLSDAWICNDQARMTMPLLFSASQLDRVATAALPLGVSDKARKYLGDLLIGSLDLLNRDRSKAKDTLWELELWQVLSRRMGMHSRLEEPDIVVSFKGANIGIACKKFYSQKNVAKVLSQAVSQFEHDFDCGIIAINLDDLTPANSILKVQNMDNMFDMMSKINGLFIKRHERHLRKYLEPGRAIAALVSTAVIADVATANPCFNNARQNTMWTIPGLAPEKEQQLHNFFNSMNAAHT